MSVPIRRAQVVAFAAVVASVVPYVALKALWLAGSRIGMRPGSPNEMLQARFVVGNIITIGLELLAVLLAWTIIRPWGQRIRFWLVFVVAGGATGLLAPILLGLPLGTVIQLVTQRTTTSGGEGTLQGWVFTVVYAGFGLLAVALAVLLGLYALQRWGSLLAAAPRTPGLRLTAVCSIGMLAFAAAMACWSVAGPGSTGPARMESVAQRTVLAVTAVLAVAGLVTPWLSPLLAAHPRSAWLLTWVGCASTALQGPTGLLLAAGGQIRVAGVLLAAIATPSALTYGLTVLKSANTPDQASIHHPSTLEHPITT